MPRSTTPAAPGVLAATLVAAAMLLMVSSSAIAQPEFSAFPDGDADSGRFTNIVNGLESLGEDEQGATGVGGTRLIVEVPGERGEFILSIFDGDYGALWDFARTPAPLVEYLLTPDVDGPEGKPDRFPDRGPNGDIIVLERWTSNEMPDNGWFECTGQNSSTPTSNLQTGVPTHEAALVTDPTHPSYDDYRYVLVVRWATPVTGGAMNCFKMRVQGQVFGPAESRFGIMGFQWGYGDYGGSDDWSFVPGRVPPYITGVPPTHYDGKWGFYWTLPLERSPYSKLDLWNGDFDVVHDTDDPHSAGIPPWVPAGNVVVRAERDNPGDPQDDTYYYQASTGTYWPMPGTMVVTDSNGAPIYDGGSRVGILHRIVFPDGSSITELNPSGNMEWENFQVAVNGYSEPAPLLDPVTGLPLYDPITGEPLYDGTKRIYPEATVPVIPVGSYVWELEGVDEQNTLFLRPDFDLFAEYGRHAIGDRVFLDADGMPSPDDLSEPGINGVKVDLYLLAENGQWLHYDSTVTGTVTDPTDPTRTIDGYYLFPGISAGEWKVVVDVPGSPALAGTRPVYDVDLGEDSLSLVTVFGDADRLDVDFSYVMVPLSADIGDYVWKDLNGNGLQDDGATGIPGVTVLLWEDTDGDGVADIQRTSTVTNTAGYYLFADLPAGRYEVRVVASTVPAYYTPTFDYDGIVTPNRAEVTLLAGEDNLAVDFGYKKSCYDQTGKIGDFVYQKKKSTSCWSTYYTNVGLPNVTLELWADTNGDGIGNYYLGSTVTNSSGYYYFSGLYAGAYEVRVDDSTLPAGLTPIYDYDGIITPHVADVTLAAGERNLDVDFGYQASTSTNTGKIGDFVYLRKKNYCGTGYTNVGLSGVKVELYLNGASVAVTTTNSSGYYYFTNLAAGNYEVRIVTTTLPENVTPYYDYDGIATAHKAALTLAAGGRNLDIDFGYQKYCPPSGKIGDFVYYVKKQTCGTGYTKVGIAGVTVELYIDANGDGTPETLLGTKVTDSNGAYLFSALEAGKYLARVDDTTLPAGFAPYYDLDGTETPHKATLTLSAGQANLDVDFGYKKVCTTTGKIGDYVYLVKKQSCGTGYYKVGLSNVTVELWLDSNNDGTWDTKVGTKVTDAQGAYLFTGLEAGKYQARVDKSTLPLGVTPYADLDGVSTPHNATLTLTTGQANLDVDFGYKKSSTSCNPPPSGGGCGDDDDDDDGHDGKPGCGDDDDDGHDGKPGCGARLRRRRRRRPRRQARLRRRRRRRPRRQARLRRRRRRRPRRQARLRRRRRRRARRQVRRVLRQRMERRRQEQHRRRRLLERFQPVPELARRLALLPERLRGLVGLTRPPGKAPAPALAAGAVPFVRRRPLTGSSR